MANENKSSSGNTRRTGNVDRNKMMLLVIALLIVILVVIICVGTARNKRSSTTTRAATSATSVYTTETTTHDVGKTIANGEKDKAVMKNGKWALPHQEGMIDDERTGVYHIIIPAVSSKPGYYYFDGGVWQPKYNGICYMGDKALTIHEGKWNPHFTGFMAFNHYLRYTVNGYYQQDYNGTIYFGEEPNRYAADVQNGAVMGYELDRDDGFIYPLNDWSAD